MNSRIVFFTNVLVLALPLVNLHAQDTRPNFHTVAGYLSGSRNEQLTQVYLIGAYNAYDHVNAMFKEQGKEPLFCPPSSLPLQVSNLQQMLDDLLSGMRASGHPAPENAPLELVLFAALTRTFPCK
jgi:hypothetical protein